MADISVSEQIARFLTAQGLTPAQVAGVTGNLKVESGYRTDAYNQGEEAIGLAQWRLGRRTALQKFAAAQGGKETDLGIQLLFLWHELTSNPVNGLAQLKAATTPAAAAAAFDQNFERSDGNARGARISEAEAIYKIINTDAWMKGNTTLTDGPLMTGGSGSSGGGGGGAGGGTPTGQEAGWSFSDPLGIGAGIDGVKSLIYKSVFAIGGLAIIGIGIAQAVKPTTDKARETAITAARTAKG